MPDAIDVLERIGALSPYFVVGTGALDDRRWRPTSALRDPEIRDELVTDLAQRIGTDEARVAASTLFLGYAARMWSVAVGSVTVSERCISLDPEQLLWHSDGDFRLHIVRPEFGDDAATEVLGRQLEPLIGAWRDVVAPGLLWGNTAAALKGACRVVGDAAAPHVDAALDDIRLIGTYDRASGRRRSCCLYYRTPGGGVCGDCPFPSPPRSPSKETP